MEPDSESNGNSGVIDYEKLRTAAHARFEEMRRDPRKGRKVVRVRAEILRNFYRRVETDGGMVFYSDEGHESGGDGKAPRPLEYFLAGLILCEMSFYARNASIMRLRIDSLRMEVEGEINWMDRARVLKYVGEADKEAEKVRSGFQGILTRLWIESPESPEKIARLVKSVEELCTAYNSLVGTVPITTEVMLNGETVQPTEASRSLPT